jgi:hypothetical protein
MMMRSNERGAKAMTKRITREECNCFALRQASRFVTQLYERHLAPVGLTAAQFTILSRLARTPGTTASAPRDARVLTFRRSPAGARRFEKAHALWLDAQAEFEQLLKRDRAKALRTELFVLTNLPA